MRWERLSPLWSPDTRTCANGLQRGDGSATVGAGGLLTIRATGISRVRQGRGWCHTYSRELLTRSPGVDLRVQGDGPALMTPSRAADLPFVLTTPGGQPVAYYLPRCDIPGIIGALNVAK